MQTTSEGLTLEATLKEISRRHLCLLSDARLWAPNTHVPRRIRQAISFHRAELVQLIVQSDWRVCASPGLHWRYWLDDRCEACAHLQIAMRTLDEAIKEKRRGARRRTLASA